MIKPTSLEEIAKYVETEKTVFFFTADWCGDCRFIQPAMPEIEQEFSEFRFVEIDRDQFIDLAATWNIFGIPSFIVTENGAEIGRLVNKSRKTKEQIRLFLSSLSD